MDRTGLRIIPDRPPFRALVITVSDSCARGEREDLSGPRCQALLREQGFECDQVAVIPDDPVLLSAALLNASDSGEFDLVLTTGGTGLSPRDFTPEATRRVIERDVPGIPELLRHEGARHNPKAVLTRGLAGLCRQALIINLPGSVKGVEEGLRTLAAVLPHALEVARGEVGRCGG